MKHTISIIMPAYNEGSHIFENISITRDVLREVNIPFEIVAVDDGSDDNTLDEIERAAQTFECVIAARNPYNMGKGMALITGFDYSTGDVIVFLDADLDLHPLQIQTLIDVLEAGPYDVVVSSKHHPESRLDYPWFRKIASWVYYIVIKALFGLPVRDTQTGLKAFRREVLQNVLHRLLVKKFAYDVELLANTVRLGYSVYEIPVVIEFKRELKWGRIRVSDILSIFIDTLAIFYRLKILKYYDVERPLMPLKGKPVLVVVRDCTPPDDVVKRLSVDTNTRIACITACNSEIHNGTMYYHSHEEFISWMKSYGHTFEIIGFLGPGYLPVGSWVKNAVRNFEDPDILAVCGPLIPANCSSHSGKAAGLLFSSFITAGPDVYLFSPRPLKVVRKGTMDNVFIRAKYWRNDKNEQEPISVVNGFIYDRNPQPGCLKYDPNVSVLKPVPPLFGKYLGWVAYDAFSKGYAFFRSKQADKRWWSLVPVFIWFMLLVGWIIVPLPVYRLFAAVYLFIVVVTGLSCFDLLTAPFFMLGILLEHIVRAFAFPAGVVAGLFKRGK